MYRQEQNSRNADLAMWLILAVCLAGFAMVKSAWLAALAPALVLSLVLFAVVALSTGRAGTWPKRALVLAAVATTLTGATHLAHRSWLQHLASWARAWEKRAPVVAVAGRKGDPLPTLTLRWQNVCKPFGALREWKNVETLLPASLALAGWPAAALAAALALRRPRTWPATPQQAETWDGSPGLERTGAPRPRPGEPVCWLGSYGGKRLAVTAAQLQTHAVVVGKTGSGKTNTLLLLAEAFAPTHGLVVLDGKGDPGFTAAVEAIGQAVGKPVWVWTCSGPTRWDPLSSGSPSELTDKIMELFEWSEPYYQDVARRYLLTVFSAAARDGVALDLARLAEYMDPDIVLDSLPSCRNNTWLKNMDPRGRRDLAGLAARIEVIRLSDPGPWLTPGEKALDLGGALSRGEIVLVSLDSDRHGATASLVGRMFVQELRVVCNRRKASPGGPPVLAVLDEFVSYPTQAIGQLYAQARSASVSLVLASQGYTDFRLVAETLLRQVTQNANLHVIHCQPDPENAQLAADLCGTRRAWEVTYQTEDGQHSGRGSLRRVHEYRFHPDVLKTLPAGEAIVLSHDPAFVTRVRVRKFIPPGERR